MSPNPVHEFLHKTEIGDAFKPAEGRVHSLSDSQSAEDAVALFEEHKVHSAPVLDKEGAVLGMVDMLDVVWSIMRVAPTATDIKRNELQSLEIAGRAMAWAPLSEIVGSSGRDYFSAELFLKSPTTQVLEQFAAGRHRVPVCDNDGLVNVLSQTAVLRYVAEHMKQGKMGDFTSQPIQKLGLGVSADNEPVASVLKSDSVLVACEKLQSASVNAVAVVDESGKLCGNFSAFDLKSLFKGKLPELTLSVGDFLAKHSVESTIPLSIKLGENVTLQTLLADTVEQKVRRWWVVDDDEKPVGVISTTDVCRALNTCT
jgi:CBS domain-containing protein